MNKYIFIDTFSYHVHDVIYDDVWRQQWEDHAMQLFIPAHVQPITTSVQLRRTFGDNGNMIINISEIGIWFIVALGSIIICSRLFFGAGLNVCICT